MNPVLLVHGGAWDIPSDEITAHTRGVSRAARVGFDLLHQGAAALDAVEAAVTVLEDDETFDAGRGSFLTADGRVQLDALMMDGATLRAGAVACVERLKNPIQAARLVLERSPHVYFVGAGAEEFARRHGLPLIDNHELVIDRERERLQTAQALASAGIDDQTFTGNQHDTVGAVALDLAGNLAAATSTGGTLNKTPGRVGDSSVIGSGGYADNRSAAASLTGWGEPIMKLVLAEMGRRSGASAGPGTSRRGCDCLPVLSPPGSWRNDPAWSRWPLRDRPQHSTDGLGGMQPKGRSRGYQRG